MASGGGNDRSNMICPFHRCHNVQRPREGYPWMTIEFNLRVRLTTGLDVEKKHLP